MVETIYNSDDKIVFDKCVEKLVHFINNSEERMVRIALCGGRSIRGLLSSFKDCFDGDWSKLQFFMVDERLVPLDDEDSNFRMLNEDFFKPLVTAGSIQSEQIHPFEPDFSKEDKGLASYEDLLKSFGGKFDVCFLGVGEDAHVAALFPNHQVLSEKDKLFVSFADSPKPPSARMSASIGLISKTSLLFAIVLGDAKKQAYLNYKNPSISVEDCPLKLINTVEQAYILTNLNV